MLNIIVGDKDNEKYLKGKVFIDYNDKFFDSEFNDSWLEDSFVRRVLETIDHIDLAQSRGSSFKNSISGNFHSHEKLSTSCKTLILIYKFPDIIFQDRFGDNARPLIDQLSALRDITIKSEMPKIYNFPFYYVNYDYLVKNAYDFVELLPTIRADNIIPLEEEEDEDDENSIDALREKNPYLYEELREHGII